MIAPRTITDDLDALLDVLPDRIANPLRSRRETADLLEVIMDLGRKPEGRFTAGEIILSETEVTEEEILHVVNHISAFGEDNRAGIERTLHRISCIRNRNGRIVGLTCRVGRAVYGTIKIVEDLIQTGKSILLLGRPGVGKTTMLREVARVLSGDMGRRVVVVDTSNEIAGDGDIPHPAIGHARRMQVASPMLQHAVMIEAVENHMPEVIIIDEIGTELEAMAARTIAERGVQLVGTAHGNTLDNLIMNPTLSDLVGGIQTVTLGDEEARRRGTQKSILERKAPPTFDVVVEIQDFNRVAVHKDVASTVDAMLRNRPLNEETRELTPEGTVAIAQSAPLQTPALTEIASYLRPAPVAKSNGTSDADVIKVFSYGLSKSRVQDVIRQTRLPIVLSESLANASAVLTSRSYYRRRSQPIRDAETNSVPIYVLKNHTTAQLQQGLFNIAEATTGSDHTLQAIREAEDASHHILNNGESVVELTPRNAYLRRLQHQIAQRYNLTSRSTGREPWRRVQIFQEAVPGEGID